MEFIVEQLAKVSTNLQRRDADFAEMRVNQASLQKAFLSLVEEDAIRRQAIGAAMIALGENVEKLTARVDRMVEASQKADECFAEFVAYSNRRR